MMGLKAEDLLDVRRWAICGAVVVGAHAAGIAAAVVTWNDNADLSLPSAAIVVDFAPVAAAPTQVENELPPGPEQVMSDASPNRPTESIEEKPEEKVEQKVVEEEMPELPPAPNPEMAVAAKEVKEEAPQRMEPRLAAPATTAPEAIPDQTASVAVAPMQGPRNLKPSNALPNWFNQVHDMIKRNQHYPAAAQSRRQQGVVMLYVSVDRKGQVLSSRVTSSSGFALLDEAAMALVRRAQPFPPPPPELPDAHIDLTVPIRFNLP